MLCLKRFSGLFYYIWFISACMLIFKIVVFHDHLMSIHSNFNFIFYCFIKTFTNFVTWLLSLTHPFFQTFHLKMFEFINIISNLNKMSEVSVYKNFSINLHVSQKSTPKFMFSFIWLQIVTLRTQSWVGDV